MESLSPTHPIHPSGFPSVDHQKQINRETSIVRLPHPTEQPPSTDEEAKVGQHDEPPGDRGAAARPHAQARATPAAPAPAIGISTTSTSPSPHCQLYSPTQTEIDSHPIRQRLSVHGDCVVASGYGLRPDETLTATGSETGIERQDETAVATSDAFGEKDRMTEVKEGDKVAWNWGSGAPGGIAAEVVTDGDAKTVSHRGNEIKKHGEPENPAVHIERPGNDVVKKASELEVEEKGPNHGSSGEEKKDEGAEEKKDEGAEEKKETNGEAKTGEKRSADEANKDDEEEKKDEGGEAKANGDAGEAAQPPKKKGRPAKNGGGGGAPKKETKKKAPKPAATADGKPRRSGRNRG